MPVDSMATVVMPHCRSHAAIWSRSQEFAPKVRTLGVARSAGTQTTWLSEWTSMAAALGLTMGIEAAALRAEGGRGCGARRAMMVLLDQRDRSRAETCRRGAEGDREREQIPQRGPASRPPMTRSHPPATMLSNGHEGTKDRDGRDP